jgi:hypothetical protein
MKTSSVHVLMQSGNAKDARKVWRRLIGSWQSRKWMASLRLEKMKALGELLRKICDG